MKDFRRSSWRSESGPYFSDTDFASAFGSSFLRNCGCPLHASLHLAFHARALQRSACLMLLFLQRLLHCPKLVLDFLPFFLFDLNLGSTPRLDLFRVQWMLCWLWQLVQKQTVAHRRGNDKCESDTFASRTFAKPL